jgi:uncharacterized protein YneF (UPF0154 family)
MCRLNQDPPTLTEQAQDALLLLLIVVPIVAGLALGVFMVGRFVWSAVR